MKKVKAFATLLSIILLSLSLSFSASAEETPDALEEYGYHRIYGDADEVLSDHTGWIFAALDISQGYLYYYEKGVRLTDCIKRVPKPVFGVTSENYSSFLTALDKVTNTTGIKYYTVDAVTDTELYFFKDDSDCLLRDYGRIEPCHWGWGENWIAYGGENMLRPTFGAETDDFGILYSVTGATPGCPLTDMMIVNTGWQEYKTKDKAGNARSSLHYFYEDGTVPADGIHLIDGKYYYFQDGMAFQNAWAYVNTGYTDGYVTLDDGNDTRFYFGMNATDYSPELLLDENGKNREGWSNYFGPDGSMQTNCWATIAGTTDSKCYLDSHGYPCTGWKTIGGKTYYFRKAWSYCDAFGWTESCYVTMQTGLTYIDPQSDRFLKPYPTYLDPDYQAKGHYYYFNKNGELLTGWITTKAGTYYADAKGVLASPGLHIIGGKTYIFDKEMHLTTGFHVEGKGSGRKSYYLNDKGVLQTGQFTVQGLTLYADDKGVLQNGWQNANGKWYYYEDGSRFTGWNTISKKKYHFDATGAMQTGWQYISGKWFYMGTNGIMTTGWKQISGKWYYFDKDGIMASNEYVDGYWIRKNGTWDGRSKKAGWQKDNTGWWYRDSSGWYPKAAWYWIDGKCYYFNKTGYLVTSSTIQGYKVDKNGACLNGSGGIYTKKDSLKAEKKASRIRFSITQTKKHPDTVQVYYDYSSQVTNTQFADASKEPCGRLNSEPNNDYANWEKLECCYRSRGAFVATYIDFPKYGSKRLNTLDNILIKGWYEDIYKATVVTSE